MDRISAAPHEDPSSPAVASARAQFSAWLKSEREARGISLEEIARVTKIQIRALERLEEAQFDELPADVFVRGFIRNYVRVVGLDADTALARYDGCGVTPGPAASARAKAMIETFSAFDPAPNAPRGVQSVVTRKVPTGPVSLLAKAPEPAPANEVRDEIGAIVASVPVPEELAEGSLRMPVAPPLEPEPEPTPEPTSEAVVEAAPLVEDAPRAKKKGKGRKSGGKRRSRKTDAPAEAQAEIVEAAAPVEAVVDAPSEGMEITILVEEPVVDPMPSIEDLMPLPMAAEPANAAEPASEPEPARPVLVTPPRGTVVRPSKAPHLVIDDADPDGAERLLEARAAEKADGKRSFLPSSVTRALLDSEKGHRGGLTLAVIILLIVATLTLSYLMRRPSSSGGGGVTSIDSTTDLVA